MLGWRAEHANEQGSLPSWQEGMRIGLAGDCGAPHVVGGDERLGRVRVVAPHRLVDLPRKPHSDRFRRFSDRENSD